MSHPQQFIDTSAIQAGDHAAFARLFAENRSRLLALAYRLTASASDAEDVVQEAFLSSWRHCDQFQGQARASTWLYRVTFNAALMRLRTRRRKGASSLDALPLGLAEATVSESREQLPTPDDVAAGHALWGELQHALHVLKPIDQELVRLRYVEDLSTEEVAERLNLTTATVKTRLHRARAALRDHLAPTISA